jgi:hypothetical protein
MLVEEAERTLLYGYGQYLDAIDPCKVMLE